MKWLFFPNKSLLSLVNMKKNRAYLLLFVLVASVSCARTVTGMKITNEEQITDDERMKWWKEARFGMFIHWGIYTELAGFYKGEAQPNSAEWIMNRGKIPIAEYEKLAEDFNPKEFNAKSFVSLAKDAGMKYMVITAKHHDGFSMFNSKASDYNIVDRTPFKRDVLKELAEECHKQNIKFGFYYSQAQDWHHPGGIGNYWDKDLKHVSADEYVYQKALPEVKQLLTEYGPIAIFWWDTPREMTKSVIDSLHHITTALQPRIITNDRLGDEYPGDHKTFERHGPRYQPEAKYWELCQPISASWGYRKDDDKFKSTSQLIHNLIDQASKGGNYLLNVSPTNMGTLKPEAVTRLKSIGAWMEKNSESIYNTQASPSNTQPDWGRITMKTVEDKVLLYLHVYDWEDGARLPIRLNNQVEKSYLLIDSSKRFKTKTSESGIEVLLTGTAPDSIASVIVMELKEKPNALPQKKLKQDKDGIIELPAYRAQYENLQGPGAQYNESLDCISNWDSETAKVYWSFEVMKTGLFELELEYSAKKDNVINIVVNGNKQVVPLVATGSNKKRFKTKEVVKIKIDKIGENEISFLPQKGKWNSMNLKKVFIKPIK